MWLWFSLAAGLFRTIKDILFKVILFDAGSVEALFCFYVFMTLFIAPFAFLNWRSKNAKGESVFVSPKMALFAVCASGMINVIAYFIFMESLRISEFSTSTALRNLVPIFALFLGVKVLKEKTGHKLIIGTILVALGVILVHSREGLGIWGTVASIGNYPSLLALSSAVLFALCATLDRYGTAKIYGGLDSIVYTTFLLAFVSGGFGILNIISGNVGVVLHLLQFYWNKLIFVGIFGALGGFFTTKAFSLGEVTKVVPALRSQVLFSVVIGGLFFQESHLVFKIIGGAILVLGIAFVAMPPKKTKA